MQASLLLPPISPAPLAPTRTLALPWTCIPKLKASKCPQLKATNAANENATVDYTSMTSYDTNISAMSFGLTWVYIESYNS